MVFTIKSKLILLGVVTVLSMSAISAGIYLAAQHIRALNGQSSVTDANGALTQRMTTHRQELVEAVYAADLSARDGQIAPEYLDKIKTASEKLDAMTSRFIGRDISYLKKEDQQKARALAKEMGEMGLKLPELITTSDSSHAGTHEFLAQFAAKAEELTGVQNTLRDAVHDEKMHIADEVIKEIEKMVEQTVLIFGAALTVMLTMLTLIIRSISRPIRRMTNAMTTLASGNTNVEIPSLGKRDEVGNMAKAVQVFKEDMLEKHQMADGFERDVKGIVSIVASAAAELSATAETLVRNMSHSTKMAASASSAATQTTGTVQSTAAAVEEMSKSTQEISTQLQRTAQLVRESANKSGSANQLANTLSTASEKVGSVMSLISGISSQINLLALNATIESARAGEAGRGFAVVANEVKNLAGQTDRSTSEIQAVVGEMRQASQDIVAALSDISGSVSSIDDATSNVASAVEEQVATTNEIARNMQTAADGTEVISGSLSQVNGAATEASAAGDQMLQASRELSKQAEQLSVQVDKFLQKVRAA